jgi:hypothetical protein
VISRGFCECGAIRRVNPARPSLDHHDFGHLDDLTHSLRRFKPTIVLLKTLQKSYDFSNLTAELLAHQLSYHHPHTHPTEASAFQ